MNKFKANSKSPVPSFLGGKEELSSFPEAIRELMSGKKIRRVEWNDKEEYGLLKDSFLMIHRNGKFRTWIVSEGDLLAIDWITF